MVFCMAAITVDCRNNWRLLDELLGQNNNPKQRQMLSQIKLHMQSENGGDIDTLMATVTQQPIYHQWSAQGEDTGTKTRGQLQEFYQNLISAGTNQFEYAVERVVIGDQCVVTEGDIKIPFQGEALLAMGQQVDAKLRYATQGRCVTFWPFDDDGKIIGEDIYTLGGFDLSQAQQADVYDYQFSREA